MKHLRMVAVVAVAALLVPGAVFAGGDLDACSARTLQGTYVFSANGFTLNPVSGVVQPKAIVEVIDFNGDGTLAVPAGTRSVNGVVTRGLSGTGSYTVNDDCTGTITFDGPAFDIFVAPRGNTLWLIQTNPNNVFQGSATRVSRDRHDGDSQ
jgi:hypothetical protein